MPPADKCREDDPGPHQDVVALLVPEVFLLLVFLLLFLRRDVNVCTLSKLVGYLLTKQDTRCCVFFELLFLCVDVLWHFKRDHPVLEAEEEVEDVTGPVLHADCDADEPGFEGTVLLGPGLDL